VPEDLEEAATAQFPAVPADQGEGDGEPEEGAERHLPGQRRARLRAGAGAVAVLGALALLLAAYLFAFTGVQAAQSQRHLVQIFHSRAGLAALTGKVPAEGQPVAVLRIPALHLDQVVVEGTSARDLAGGPGLMPGSVLPGLRGNTVIAGRSLFFGAPFAHLDTLPPGSRITVVGGFGAFTYRVARVLTVQPGSSDPVVPTAGPRLTLVTSPRGLTPSGRVAVLAPMVSHPVTAGRLQGRVPPRAERALSGASGAVLPTVLWGAALLAVLVAVVLINRRWRHPAALYLMAVPVLVVLALLCFSSFAALLPATL
jgi:sortase A